MFVYKRSMLDQNLKGLAEKIWLPRPWQVQNRNRCGRLNFWATSSKFFGNSYLNRIVKSVLDICNAGSCLLSNFCQVGVHWVRFRVSPIWFKSQSFLIAELFDSLFHFTSFFLVWWWFCIKVWKVDWEIEKREIIVNSVPFYW